jgi:hypothetical protein
VRYTGVEEEAEDPAMRSVLGIAVCLGLGLTLGAGSPRSAPRVRRALSFKPTTGVVSSASRASVLVDTSTAGSCA